MGITMQHAHDIDTMLDLAIAESSLAISIRAGHENTHINRE